MFFFGYVLMALGWNSEYIYSIYFQLKHKGHVIPCYAVASNLAWEIIASIYFTGLERIVCCIWTLLDCLIVLLMMREKRLKRKKKIGFIFVFIVSLTIFYFLIFNLDNGWEVSGFFIDLTMSVLFLLDLLYFRETDEKQNRYWVILCKTMGDFGAWMTSWSTPIILPHILAFAVLCLNIIYLICLKDRQ